jgi:hypothetical protein
MRLCVIENFMLPLCTSKPEVFIFDNLKIILQIYEKSGLDVFLTVRLRLIIPKIFISLCIIENFMLPLQKKL